MFAVIKHGVPERITPQKPFTDAAGVQHPASALRLWSALELAAIGVHRIVTDPVPSGYRATSRTLTWDGETIRRVYELEPVEVDLPALKATLKAAIDEEAEAERARYITLGAGQAMTYTAKAAEAARAIQDPEPLYADYPLLSAEIGITGETIHQVAQIVANLHAQWQAIGAIIEQVRLAAKASIDAAPDEAAARAVTAAWPAGGAS